LTEEKMNVKHRHSYYSCDVNDPRIYQFISWQLRMARPPDEFSWAPGYWHRLVSSLEVQFTRLVSGFDHQAFREQAFMDKPPRHGMTQYDVEMEVDAPPFMLPPVPTNRQLRRIMQAIAGVGKPPKAEPSLDQIARRWRFRGKRDFRRKVRKQWAPVAAETPAYLFWRAGSEEAEWEVACKTGGEAMLALLKKRQE
jgi:hypothetical protein